MLALLFGQWHFSQAHIITWRSLTLSALILSESYLSWGGRGLHHVVTWKHYINSRHSSLVQAASSLAVMRKHAVNQKTERNILVLNDG